MYVPNIIQSPLKLVHGVHDVHGTHIVHSAHDANYANHAVHVADFTVLRSWSQHWRDTVTPNATPLRRTRHRYAERNTVTPNATPITTTALTTSTPFAPPKTTHIQSSSGVEDHGPLVTTNLSSGPCEQG